MRPRSLPGFDGPQVLLCPARQPGEGGPDRRAVLGEFVAHADRPVVDHRAGREAEIDQFDEAFVEDAVVDAGDAALEVAEIDRLTPGASADRRARPASPR